MSGNFITRPVVQEVRVWSQDIRGDELEEMNFTQYDSPIIHEAGTGYRKQDENIR